MIYMNNGVDAKAKLHWFYFTPQENESVVIIFRV